MKAPVYSMYSEVKVLSFTALLYTIHIFAKVLRVNCAKGHCICNSYAYPNVAVKVLSFTALLYTIHIFAKVLRVNCAKGHRKHEEISLSQKDCCKNG